MRDAAAKKLMQERLGWAAGKRDAIAALYEMNFGESIYEARMRKGIVPVVPPLEYFLPEAWKVEAA